MISKYFLIRNCLFKSALTVLFIVHAFMFLMNRIINEAQFWRSHFFKRCIFCAQIIFFWFVSDIDIFFFRFQKSILKKKNSASAHFVNSHLFEWKKRWQKKRFRQNWRIVSHCFVCWKIIDRHCLIDWLKTRRTNRHQMLLSQNRKSINM